MAEISCKVEDSVPTSVATPAQTDSVLDTDSVTMPVRLCSLPPLNAIANQLLTLSANPNIELRELSKVMECDPAFAAEYHKRLVEPRRDQARTLFRRAVERGEIPADTDIEVAVDMVYGPLWHRLLHAHLPLNDRFVQDVVTTALNGIQPAADRVPPTAG